MQLEVAHKNILEYLVAIPVIATPFSYLTVYLFYGAYLNYFGIPPSFISFGLPLIIKTFSVLVSCFLMYYVWNNIFKLLVENDSSSELKKRIKLNVPLLVFPLICVIIAWPEYKSTLMTFVFICIFLAWDFAPCIRLRNNPDRENLLKQVYDRKRNALRENSLFAPLKFIGNSGSQVILIILYTLTFAGLGGRSFAVRQEKFLVFQKGVESYAVVAEYNDKLLAVKLNLENSTFTEGLVFLDPDQLALDSGLLKATSLGRLKPGN